MLWDQRTRILVDAILVKQLRDIELREQTAQSHLRVWRRPGTQIHLFVLIHSSIFTARELQTRPKSEDLS